VALVNRGFVNDARSAAASKGVPGARFVLTNIPCECTVPDKIAAGVQEVLSDVVDGLTKPLKPEEIAPEARPTELTQGIVFEGDLAEVQRFFYKRGWTDGLPIMPPTREAVEEMLAGTDLPPEHMVGKMIPRLGKATVEKIAINAAMAGALPTAMPVLIAAVEAMLDPLSSYGIFQVSTGSWSPFLIVNGPIREQIRVNGSSGAMSPGDLADGQEPGRGSQRARRYGRARQFRQVQHGARREQRGQPVVAPPRPARLCPRGQLRHGVLPEWVRADCAARHRRYGHHRDDW
jgi:hypothetical protein